jgi:imidazolonepropionase-like amidohydrolase
VHIKDTCCLDAVIDAGVAAVRDAGMRGNALPGMHAIDRNNSLPLIISARWAVYKKGGYGSSFGLPVETPEEMKSAIHLLKNAGAGIIKIMASGIVSFKEPGRVTAGGFNKEELRFIVQAAATCGLEVMAHVNGEQDIIDVAEAGVRSIEHGFFMSERALVSMVKKAIYWVPTVGALKRAAESGNVAKESEAFVAGLIRSHLEMMLHAHGLGVPLAVGTDCVLPDPHYREAYDAELAYFEQAGIPYDEVRKIACDGGARLLGI